jgi:hypothetical protein
MSFEVIADGSTLWYDLSLRWPVHGYCLGRGPHLQGPTFLTRSVEVPAITFFLAALPKFWIVDGCISSVTV